MTSQSLQATVLISAAALMGSGWGLARLHSSRTPEESGVKTQTELHLKGKWQVPETVPVIDPLIELDVPLNSWVAQGQLIGMTRTGARPDPSIEQEARLRLSEANDAVAEARREVQALDGEVAGTDAVASDAESRLVQAENAAVATESVAPERNQLYRSGLADSLTHDKELQRRQAAEEQAQKLQEQAVVPGSNDADLKAARSGAREKLRAALEEQQAAQSALANITRAAGIVPVQAPAEGFLVIRDENSGTYEIALSARPRVAATVAEAERALVQRGQTATISCAAQPGVAFHAKVESVGNAQEDDEGHTVFPVTLVVTDPGARLPDDTSVTASFGG